jgi:hypothetical protein
MLGVAGQRDIRTNGVQRPLAQYMSAVLRCCLTVRLGPEVSGGGASGPLSFQRIGDMAKQISFAMSKTSSTMLCETVSSRTVLSTDHTWGACTLRFSRGGQTPKSGRLPCQFAQSAASRKYRGQFMPPRLLTFFFVCGLAQAAEFCLDFSTCAVLLSLNFERRVT